MATFAVIVALITFLVAGYAIYAVYQVSKKVTDRTGLATVAGLDGALKRITELPTWNDIQKQLDEYYLLKKFSATKKEVAAVKKNIEDAISSIPKPSPLPIPQTESRSVALEKAVTALTECLRALSQGLLGDSRTSVEREIREIESKGQAEKEALQKARSDAQRLLHDAEKEFRELSKNLPPREPTEEMAQAHVEETMPDAGYRDKLAAFDKFVEDYPSWRLEYAEKVDQAQQRVDVLKAKLEEARDAQTAFERSNTRTPAENGRLRELRDQMANLDTIEAGLARTERALQSVPTGRTLSAPPSRNSPVPHIPPPPLPMGNSGKEPIGFVREDEFEEDAPDSVDVEELIASLPPPTRGGNTCPHCGRETPPEHKFCGKCGTLLPPAD